MITTENCPSGSRLRESVEGPGSCPFPGDLSMSIQFSLRGKETEGATSSGLGRVCPGFLVLGSGARRWPWTQTQQRLVTMAC